MRVTSDTALAQASAAANPRLSFIDFNQPHCPPERQWLIRDRIPLRQPTLFTGKGGGGKTLLALQLCAATALDQDWLGMPASPGHAIYLGAEDEADELHRRIAAIADHYQVPTSGLANRLHVASVAGRDALLAERRNRGSIEATPLFNELHEMACDLRPKVIVLDTVSDIFSGDENDRSQVTAFTTLLRKLAMDAGAAVIITAHPSQYGLSTGSGLSGSTAWHGKVRSQLYLKHERGDRELQFLKNNYGPENGSIDLVWRDGVFIPHAAGSLPDLAERQKEAQSVFLRLLARYASQNRNVTEKSGTTYAPSVFAKELEARSFTKKELEAAMLQLLKDNIIMVQIEGPPSRRRSKLVLVGGGT